MLEDVGRLRNSKKEWGHTKFPRMPVTEEDYKLKRTVIE